MTTRRRSADADLARDPERHDRRRAGHPSDACSGHRLLLHHYRVLSRADFDLYPPPVPRAVAQAVTDAGERWYARAPLPRRVAEYLQDVIALALPSLAYHLDFSVGRYRAKSSTIGRTAAWAIAQGYLVVHGPFERRLTRLLPYS